MKVTAQKVYTVCHELGRRKELWGVKKKAYRTPPEMAWPNKQLCAPFVLAQSQCVTRGWLESAVNEEGQ